VQHKPAELSAGEKQLLSILIMLFLKISLYGQFKAKMAMKSPAESPMSKGNDPLKSFEIIILCNFFEFSL